MALKTNKAIYKPSLKMITAYKESKKAKYTILEGAIRSGKSYVGNDIAIRDIQQLPPCNVLVSGYSITSVARNVIAEWREMIDPRNIGLFKNVRDSKDDYLTINWRGLRDKKFYIRGAGKETDYKQIQGSTIGYWLSDETVRHAETFVDMAISRLSNDYSKALWTMNPDSPFHYIKKRFIDNEELYIKDAKGFSEFTKVKFFLEDNPSLSRSYIKSLERLYSGVFYKRFIQSLWVIAEGAIYDFYTDNAPFIIDKKDLPQAKRYIVGIDYGTGNPTCFILFGVNPSTKPNVWAEREYYYDSKAQQKQLTDSEYSQDLRKFIGGTKVTTIILDPSAASFKTQLKRDNFLFVKDADNAVIDGIRTQARMLKSGAYAICKDCRQTRKDYDGYVWDSRAQLIGEDKPVKQNDHTKDVERYVLHTIFGRRRLAYELFTQM